MNTYDIDVDLGDQVATYTVQANSEDEARTLALNQAGSSGGVTPTGLPDLNTPTNQNETQRAPGAIRELTNNLNITGNTNPNGNVPEPLQLGAQAATMPARGFRGIGVGIQKALAGLSPAAILPGQGGPNLQDVTQVANNLPGAIQSAADATRPGFVPGPGEKIGAAIGEATGMAPMALAAAGPTASLGLAWKVLADAGAAAGLTAVQQASERGDIDITDIGLAGAFGGLVPTIQVAPKFMARFVRNAVEMPLASGSTLSREAMGELLDDPALLAKHSGTAEEINSVIGKAQGALKNQMAKVSQRLQRARLNFGIQEPFEDAVDRAIQQGFPKKTSQEMAQEYRTIQTGWEQLPADPAAKPDTPAQFRKIPDKERIARSYLLRRDVDQFGAAKYQQGVQIQKTQSADDEDVLLRQIRDRINPLVEKIAPNVPGASLLRITDEAYAASRGLYNSFLNALSDEDKAAQIMGRIFRKGNPDDILGLDAKTVKLFRRLEQKTGDQFVDPLRKEIASREFRTLKARNLNSIGSVLSFPAGIAADTAGGENVAKFLNFMYQKGSVLTRLAEAAAKNATTPMGRAAATGFIASEAK